MKEGWKYKKLGEVGTVIGGSTPKTDVPEFWDGDFAWITPAELDGSKYVNSTSRTITKDAISKTNLTLLPVGTVLLSSRAPIGKVCITKIPMYCNQGFKNIVCSDELNNEFLYWWLKGKTEYLNSLGVGATFKEISKRIVEQITIPVPPIETQSHIVSELDLLQSIIDKQQAQLKELDNLAQSIFYDMFGDPVENEKGWEKLPFEQCIQKVKYTTKLQSKDYLNSGKYPIISQEEEFISGYWNEEDDVFRVSSPVVIFGDHTRILKYVDFDFVLGADGVKIFLPISSIIPRYFLHFLKASRIPSLGYSRHYKLLKEMSVSIPPIEMQQMFSNIIESIEIQKANISKSIEETQRLFDYTMDKYFG